MQNYLSFTTSVFHLRRVLWR